MQKKTAYICGPLTELSPEERLKTKQFYEAIAKVFEEAHGIRAFVPHEHYDPIKHADFSPEEVDRVERRQVAMLTSILVVVPVAPSWGGGIEVEIANQHGVPVWLVWENDRPLSRLLRGNPAIEEFIRYDNRADALESIRIKLKLAPRFTGGAVCI